LRVSWVYFVLISVIIPMRNEEGFVGKCLQSFLSQIESRDDVEILCVDGMSTDKTREIINQFSKINSNIRLVINPHKIVSTSLNIAIPGSRGEYIVVAGCHAEYAPDYLTKCLEVIQRTGADQVGGYMVTCPGSNTNIGVAITAATSCIFGVGNSMFRLTGPERQVDIVPFGMYRRNVFEKIGLYDERLVRNQDIEFNKRLLKAGGKTIISPEIKLKYYNRSTYRGMWQQAFNNGLWNPYTIWLVGRGRLSLRHFIPGVFMLSLILPMIGSLAWWPIGILSLVSVFLYFLIAAFFAIRLSRNNHTSAFKIICAFVVLHFAYGIGSLWGFVTAPFKFPNRRSKAVGKSLSDRKI